MLLSERPKTRSGEIMRCLVRDVAENREIGDVTTLADNADMQQIPEGHNLPRGD